MDYRTQALLETLSFSFARFLLFVFICPFYFFSFLFFFPVPLPPSSLFVMLVVVVFFTSSPSLFPQPFPFSSSSSFRRQLLHFLFKFFRLLLFIHLFISCLPFVPSSSCSHSFLSVFSYSYFPVFFTFFSEHPDILRPSALRILFTIAFKKFPNITYAEHLNFIENMF